LLCIFLFAATEAEKELNQASEKLQKITATVDTENKNLNQVNEKILKI
jgi:exonuclease VII small subunit